LSLSLPTLGILVNHKIREPPASCKTEKANVMLGCFKSLPAEMEKA